MKLVRIPPQPATGKESQQAEGDARGREEEGGRG